MSGSSMGKLLLRPSAALVILAAPVVGVAVAIRVRQRRLTLAKAAGLALVVSLMLVLAPFQFVAHAQENERPVEPRTFYRAIEIDGLSVFYREAGAKEAPTLLLLHGFPSSSRMFEPLFSRLADR